MIKCEACGRKAGINGRIEGCDLPIALNKAITDYGKAQKAMDKWREEKSSIVWRLFYARLAQAKIDVMLAIIRELENDIEKCSSTR